MDGGTGGCVDGGCGGCVDGGSVNGGHGSLIGGAGDGVPAFIVPVRTPGLVYQGQSMKTQRTSIACLHCGVEYLKGSEY